MSLNTQISSLERKGRMFESEDISRGQSDELEPEVSEAESRRSDSEYDSAGEATDTIREYLRAIGQHPLLTRAQEIPLGLAVERRMQLRAAREGLTEKMGREPTNAELGAKLYLSLVSHKDSLAKLASIQGIEVTIDRIIGEFIAVPRPAQESICVLLVNIPC